MIKDYFLIALKNLKHRGLRSWLTILGIFIGIAAVVALISLGEGLQTAITGQFGTLSTDKLIIQNAGTGFGPPGSTVIRKLTSHDLDLINSISGIELATGRLVRMVKIEHNKNTVFSYITNVPETKQELELVYSSMDIEVEQGKLLSEDDKGEVVLGNNFVSNNQFDKPIKIGSVLLIDGQEFKVKGILKKSSSFQVNLVVFMSQKDMEKLLNIGDEIDMIVAQVDNPSNAEQIAKDIERRLAKDRNEKPGEEDFTVQTPLQAISSVNTILNIINFIVIAIAAISLIVGAVGITNTMYTSVLERTREIGIMKAIGAQNKDILIIFLIESGLLGLVGGIIGAIIGLGMAMSVSYVASSVLGGIDLMIKLSWPLLISTILFSFIVGAIAGVLPAMQASKLKPVEALRKWEK